MTEGVTGGLEGFGEVGVKRWGKEGVGYLAEREAGKGPESKGARHIMRARVTVTHRGREGSIRSRVCCF